MAVTPIVVTNQADRNSYEFPDEQAADTWALNGTPTFTRVRPATADELAAADTPGLLGI